MSALRIAKAVAAGLTATWLMDRADEPIYAAQSEARRPRPPARVQMPHRRTRRRAAIRRS